jgi:hypothetical protein
MIKRAKGAKVKFLSQGLYMTCVVSVLVYNFKFYILGILFNIAFYIQIHFNYKLILYHVYYAFMPSITWIWTTFVKGTFSKSIIFKVKNTFEPNVLKWVINLKNIGSNHFPLLIINVKIPPIFKRNGAHLVFKKNVWKKQELSIFKVWVFWTCINIFWFVSKFEHVNFEINGKYSKKLWQFKLLWFTCDLSNIQSAILRSFNLSSSFDYFLPLGFYHFKWL